MKRVRKTTLAASVSAALFLAAGAPIGAQTDLTIENDGLTLTAGAVSSEQILSIKLRISGPNGFQYEERLEDSLVQWVPEEQLADGWYTWEAFVVTVEPGAPMLDVSAPSLEAASFSNDPDGAEALNAKAPAGGIPAERLYADEFKGVERRSGRFQVLDGFIVPAVETGEELGGVEPPGLFGKVAGAIVDFVFPSAHAGTCTTPCLVEGNLDAEVHIRSDADGTNGGPYNWELESDESVGGRFGIGPQGLVAERFRIEFGAPIDALYVSEPGHIGLGTATPGAMIHMADPIPAIRYEDTDGAQQWTLLAGSAGYRVADDTALTVPFLIEQGVPTNTLRLDSAGHIGIGTATPTSEIHMFEGTRAEIRMQSNTTEFMIGSGQGTGFTIREGVGTGTTIFQIDIGAPANSLSIENNGNVGLGTSAPQDALHIFDNAGGAGILLEETSAIATNTMLEMRHNGNPGFQMENTGTSAIWQFRLGGSGGSEQFTVNKVGTGSPEASFVSNGNLIIRGSLIEGSSREIKQDIAPVNADDLLSRLEALDVVEWSYTSSPGNRHIGPMAEEFYELFGFGKDDKTIFPRDLAGIALAAAKEVHQRNRALEAQNAELLERLERIEAQLKMD